MGEGDGEAVTTSWPVRPSFGMCSLSPHSGPIAGAIFKDSTLRQHTVVETTWPADVAGPRQASLQMEDPGGWMQRPPRWVVPKASLASFGVTRHCYWIPVARAP